jgi:acetyl esterase/lipase
MGIESLKQDHNLEFEIPMLDVNHIKRKYLDIPYAGLSQDTKLDLFLPENGSGPFPLVIYIHGGAFAIGDKRESNFQFYLNGLERGYAVATVNYRLSGEAVFPAGIQDVKAAIRWLRAHSEKYQLNPEKFAACGGSSGGNFAAMVCLTDNVDLFTDESLGNPGESCRVQAAVEWFGPTDFLLMDQQLRESGFGMDANHSRADSPESRYLGQMIAEVPIKVELANPMTYVHTNMPPLLIQHGRLDTLVPVQQSIMFVEKMERLVSPDRFEFDIIEGAGHGGPQFMTEGNVERVFSFLDLHLK